MMYWKSYTTIAGSTAGLELIIAVRPKITLLSSKSYFKDGKVLRIS